MTSHQYKIGSLFSGIGGFELGLERAGVGRTIWQCEIDAFCRDILKHHWPDATQFENVETLNPATVEPCDVLIGGFPCQDISAAGKGKGIEGQRSGLFFEIVRIACGIRPRFIILENVPAITRRGLGRILGSLAEIGYDAEWFCISAQGVGASHLRERWFCIAWPQLADADGARLQRQRHNPRQPQKPEPRNGSGQNMADADGDAIRNNEQRSTRGRHHVQTGRQTVVEHDSFKRTPFAPGPEDLQLWATVPPHLKPSVCRMAYGLSPELGSRAKKLKALGNAIVPQCAELVGRRLLEIDHILKTTTESNQ